MILAIAIGNNEISVGGMEEGRACFTASLSSRADRTADEYAALLQQTLQFRGFDPRGFEGAILCSVVPPLTETVCAAVTMLTDKRPRVLGSGMKTGLNILTDDPSQLGGDLVAEAVGAAALYPAPLVIIDCGTATAFSVLDEGGAYRGCAIAPGIDVSCDALTGAASLLPAIAKVSPGKCIGTSTAESMKSGCLYGSASMIDGMICRMQRELGKDFATVVATGKNAPAVLPFCETAITYDETLILRGLALIYERNIKKRR